MPATVRNNSSNSRCEESPRQSARDAASILLNSRGILPSSINAGTRIPRSAPSAASVFTQRDDTEVLDQSTTTQRAELNAFSIVSSNDLPGGISRSHQTDQPFWENAFASSSAFSLSALA